MILGFWKFFTKMFFTSFFSPRIFYDTPYPDRIHNHRSQIHGLLLPGPQSLVNKYTFDHTTRDLPSKTERILIQFEIQLTAVRILMQFKIRVTAVRILIQFKIQLPAVWKINTV